MKKYQGLIVGRYKIFLGNGVFCVCAGLQTNEDKMKAMVYITGFMWGLQVKSLHKQRVAR